MSNVDEYGDEDDFDDTIGSHLAWLDTPLRRTHNEIRLLRLHQGSLRDVIRCSLYVVSLDTNPKYEALSYVWGDASDTVAIEVANQHFGATRNLHEFLRELRLPGGDRVLWVDAICINQVDDKEKEYQIGMMRQIYTQAADVHIWFGPMTSRWQEQISIDDWTPTSTISEYGWSQAYEANSHRINIYLKTGGDVNSNIQYCNPRTFSPSDLLDATFRVLAEIVQGKQPKDFSLYIRNPRAYLGEPEYAMNRTWPWIQDCVRWLQSNEYWERVWTLQEAVLPRSDPKVHVGDYIFNLSALTKGVRAMNALQGIPVTTSVAMPFFTIWRGGVSRNAQEIEDIAEYRELMQDDDDPQIAVWNAISSSRGRKATHVRDHFWGFTGLLNAATRQYFQERSYSLDPKIIFAECSKLLIETDDGMRAIGESVGVGPSGVPGLPTWAIDLSTDRDGEFETVSHWRHYNACGESKQPQRLQYMHEVQGESVTLRGVLIDKVVSSNRPLSHESRRGGGHRAQLKRIQEWDETYKSTARRLGKSYDADSFWRAVLMDRNVWLYWLHQRRPLPGYRLREVQEWWDNYQATGDGDDLTEDGAAGDGRRGDYHYRAVKWNTDRHRFFCTRTGTPGLGPQEIEPGDEVWLLAGCQAMAFLRPITRGNQEAFNFVGLGYVDRGMYGEHVPRNDAGWHDVVLY